jgi:hypothetical protein
MQMGVEEKLVMLMVRNGQALEMMEQLDSEMTSGNAEAVVYRHYHLPRVPAHVSLFAPFFGQSLHQYQRNQRYGDATSSFPRADGEYLPVPWPCYHENAALLATTANSGPQNSDRQRHSAYEGGDIHLFSHCVDRKVCTQPTDGSAYHRTAVVRP